MMDQGEARRSRGPHNLEGAMSGIVGHTMYAVLALKAAEQRGLPLAAISRRNFASFIAGAYLGCDVQTMPEAICVDTGRECGYGTVPVERSPFTGGAVKQFRLATPEGAMTAHMVHERFYGRAHLVFGWTGRDQPLRVPWDHLPDYFAAAIEDAFGLFPPSERAIAYALGWIVHVVGDSLIKGIQPGIGLNLVDGRYTPRNRPVQDLFTFHEIGIRELRLNWPALFNDMADTPVEALQLHYMRCAEPRGRLAEFFGGGWRPGDGPTLHSVLAENRRWVRHHAHDVLEDMKLTEGECREVTRRLVGLNYREMIAAAERADLRGTLRKIGEEAATMFGAVAHRSKALSGLPADDGPSWDEIVARWRDPK